MRLLLFVDLHGDVKELAQLKKKSASVDYSICAGDISQMEHNLKELLTQLNDFASPVFLINGNHEDEERLKDMCKNFKNIIFLQKGAHHVKDCVLLGYGGGGIAQTDHEFTRIANSFFKKEINGKKIILITHAPPYKTKLDNAEGEHRGNKSITLFIEEVQPLLAVCGHLHENAGKMDKIGDTVIINPGKQGVVVEV